MLKHRVILTFYTALFVTVYFTSFIHEFPSFLLIVSICLSIFLFIYDGLRGIGVKGVLPTAVYVCLAIITAILLAIIEEHAIIVKDPMILKQAWIHSAMFYVIPFLVTDMVSAFFVKQNQKS
ncbi:hypothetical protein CAFE_15330 [Caprobacter fermentans]|uniref:Uncharacterized protein n=2 Tax=Caproicibacter TaxID=2576755 RepID=A0A6N8HZ05_9FIRM|nr:MULTISPECIES: hypothetical protein [Acutalibacteraceae]MVB10835.1 hypothetical protein [Caproicibacter fermentans]QAT50249.1 hypothetical protein EQM14_11005 [Caproiciproducens sp. NJN-50]